MASPTVWYFAYGSNLSRAQMRSRAGAFLEERPARLEGYEIVFNKRARGGSATANIRAAAGKSVEGILYRIAESSFRNLDRFEGVPVHYRRTEVTVVDREGNKYPAQVYIATKVEKGILRPAAHYLQAILEGATEHGFPPEYIKRLKEAAQAT